MTKLDIKLENIGGLKKLETSFDLGKLNVVRGTSSSGKSSLLRGIHLGVVGSVPLQGLYTDEISALHLNDRNSDQALLHRGAQQGTVELSSPSGGFKSTIPRNGEVRSTSSNPKGLFTTMLSSLPQTQIHQRVFNPTSDEPNNFKWVVDDFSDAGKYQTWHDLLARVEQELGQIRSKFGSWKLSLASADDQRGAINAELEEVQARIQAKAAESGAEAAKLENDISRVQTSLNMKEGEFRRAEAAFRESEAKNKFQSERKKSAESLKSLAKRRLNDADDLLEEGVFEPNISGHDATIADLQEEVARYEGAQPTEGQAEALAIYNSEPESIKPVSMLKAMEKMSSEVGDSEKLADLQSKLAGAKKARQDIVNDYLDRKRRYGMAEQQAAAARSEIKSAEQIIAEADVAMAQSGSNLPKEKADFERFKREFQAAKQELQTLKAKRTTGGDDNDAKLQAQLIKKLEAIENSTTFEVRFTSLGMLASETLNLSLADADNLLSKDDSQANIAFVNTHLEKSASEIRSLLKANLTSGVLNTVVSTSAWTREEADRQRQETRRVFNDVGTNLFNRMKFSQINGIQLDTDYNISISWDGEAEPTGLTGAGGERTIIAATLLIAMRKAYTPEIPVLMFDGVIENLDESPQREFLNFLDEYAINEGVAIVVSLLDENSPTPKVN